MDIYLIVSLSSITLILFLLAKFRHREFTRKINYRDRIQLDTIADNNPSLEELGKNENPSHLSDLGEYYQTPSADGESSQSSEDNSIIYLDKGLKLLEVKKNEESIVHFNKAIELSQIDGTPYYYRGIAKSNLNLLNDAVEDFTDAILRKLKKAEVFYQRGYTLLKMGDKIGALQDFNKYLMLDKSNPEVYFQRGSLEFEKENYKNAIEDFTNAILLNPNHECAYFKRGIAKQKLGDTKGCCKDWQAALDRGNLEAYHYLKTYCK